MVVREPRQLPTDATASFLGRVLPRPPALVLEVGCGRGEVALRLRDMGYAITPLDKAPDAVGAARASGLQAVECDFLTYRGGPFDVVLFTRSLHHIQPLESAIERTASLLRPDGLLVGEEFAREAIDADTAAWYFDTCDLLRTAGLLPDQEGAATDDPLERWSSRFRSGHAPPTTGNDLLRAIGRRFELVEADRRVPYHYRYLADHLPQTELGARLTRLVMEMELRRLTTTSGPWAGLRFVARRTRT
jgi:SAM-dependent methyltransferase